MFGIDGSKFSVLVIEDNMIAETGRNTLAIIEVDSTKPDASPITYDAVIKRKDAVLP